MLICEVFPPSVQFKKNISFLHLSVKSFKIFKRLFSFLFFSVKTSPYLLKTDQSDLYTYAVQDDYDFFYLFIKRYMYRYLFYTSLR